MPNSPPPPDPDRPTSRVVELEEKIMFQQQAHDQLNSVVLKQQSELERLGRELESLRSHVRQVSDLIPGDELPPEKPPHY
jgi:SlyX protein